MKNIFFILSIIIMLILIIIFSYLNIPKFPEDTISVIIPTYNREKLILDTIYSVLNQTYKKMEILIIDDYSTDNTEKIIENIKDNRVKYIKLNKKYGANYARNFGINLAKGKYISFLDSDDIFHKDKLKMQLKNINKYKSDMDFCKINVHINSLHYSVPDRKKIREIYKGNIFNELISNGNFISTQSIIVKKIYIKKYMFDIKFPRLQDYDLVLRMIPNLKVSYTNKALVDLYIQKDSITSFPKKLKQSILLLLII